MNEERHLWTRRLIGLYQEQLNYGAEIVELTEQFFKKDVDYTEEAKQVLNEEQVPEVLTQFAKELNEIDEYSVADIKKAIKATQKATGQKGKKLFMPIRVAVSGQTHGPELGDTIELLGKAIVVSRLELQLKLNKK